ARSPAGPSIGGSNTDDTFVILTFSGGGTRAAALSYGVLDELRRIRIECANASEAQSCSKSLLDELDVISSVSGGSFTAAYYALHRDEMFQPASRFLTRFLHYNAERELFGEA